MSNETSNYVVSKAKRTGAAETFNRILSYPFYRVIAPHFREPRGWFGRWVAGYLLDRANRRIIASAVGHMAPGGQRILELGAGTGAAIRPLLSNHPGAKAVAVDLSPAMVATMKRRLQAEITSGRLDVLLGDLAHLPFSNGEFDRVLSVNTVYFWQDPLSILLNLRWILASGGQLTLAFRSAEKMAQRPFASFGFHLIDPQQMATWVREAGFHDVELVQEDRDAFVDINIITAWAP